MTTGKPCGLPVSTYMPQDRCLFHVHSNNKAQEFHDCLIEKIERELKDEPIRIIDCSGFVFPQMELEGIDFSKTLNLSGTVFLGAFHFKRCSFSGDAFNAEGVQFKGYVGFWNCLFNNKNMTVDFREGRFGDTTEFLDTVFNVKRTSFQSCEFRDLSMHRCIFSGESFKCNAYFKGNTASISDCRFISKRTDFSRSEFLSGRTFFYSNEFSGELTTFDTIQFRNQRTEFRGNEFDSEYTAFDDSVFLGRATFSNLPDRKQAFTGIMSFMHLDITSCESISFQHIDLSWVRFANTDLTSIEFIDVTWCPIPYSKPKRRGLFDEILFREVAKGNSKATPRSFVSLLSSEKESIISAENVEAIRRAYQQLRYNSEEQKDYMSVGDFYYGEMEMRRMKLPFWERIIFSWEALYRIVSGYGERWLSSIAIIIIILLVFPALILYSGINQIDYDLALSIRPPLEILQNYWDAFKYNLLSILYLKDVTIHYQPTIETKLLQTIEIVVLPALATLFILALRRKFKR